MVFFALFLWNMLCGVWANQAGDPVVAQQNRQKLHVVIKMFFVMGVSWIAEIISFFLNWFVGSYNIYKSLLFFQLINSLQVPFLILCQHNLVETNYFVFKGLIMFCVIYFDTARVKKIWNVIQRYR